MPSNPEFVEHAFRDGFWTMLEKASQMGVMSQVFDAALPVGVATFGQFADRGEALLEEDRRRKLRRLRQQEKEQKMRQIMMAQRAVR